MKSTLAALSLFAPLFAPFAAANFDLYLVTENNAGDTQNFGMWSIFEAEPDCNNAWNAYTVQSGEDVSGGAGVVCEGVKECYYDSDPSAVSRLEMNFNNDDPTKYHFTIYKDRNLDMIGLDGNVYGNCIVFPGDDFDCRTDLAFRYGKRMFRCLTAITAALPTNRTGSEQGACSFETTRTGASSSSTTNVRPNVRIYTTFLIRKEVGVVVEKLAAVHQLDVLAGIILDDVLEETFALPKAGSYNRKTSFGRFQLAGKLMRRSDGLHFRWRVIQALEALRHRHDSCRTRPGMVIAVKCQPG
ncbi:hypothetical protein BU23DRAFT_597921 [Bimuria novae-zelandiae CBS 107.79]|uniref:Uncharacterized protein n=1 Tax=Bimuria novae-zelandiae CBS 107.79 TaxID=1447943 RepID=A0A6A5VCR4_9PLEO|nr:hypothetical protein BU23DRAFT_597921 [Bimuria novae-zelandiae CBS 107.79]